MKIYEGTLYMLSKILYANCLKNETASFGNDGEQKNLPFEMTWYEQSRESIFSRLTKSKSALPFVTRGKKNRESSCLRTIMRVVTLKAHLLQKYTSQQGNLTGCFSSFPHQPHTVPPYSKTTNPYIFFK
jgi:hypothetical protein